MKKVSREKYIDVAKLLAIICVMISHTNLLPNEINVFFNTFYIVIFFTCAGLTLKKEKTTC